MLKLISEIGQNINLSDLLRIPLLRGQGGDEKQTIYTSKLLLKLLTSKQKVINITSNLRFCIKL
jgi:predicted DNA-binding ribbon-helix-helix protein